jgi:hypothetical protein
MPLLSVLKAAFRFGRAHGDRRDYRPPSPIVGGVLHCEKCGCEYVVSDITAFILCEGCGGKLLPAAVMEDCTENGEAGMGQELKEELYLP